MINKLHKRLTLLYTLTTGMILTLVVVVIAFVSEQYLNQNNEKAFQNQLVNVSGRIQADALISVSWLAQVETDNNMIVHIEENQKPLLYKGSWTPPTPRETLVEKAKEMAKQQNVDTSKRPLSAISGSSKFIMHGNKNDKYLAAVLVFPEKNSFKSLVLINYISKNSLYPLRQRLLFVFADILGILALFFVSWKFVGKSLEPIRINKQKQNEFIAAASHELRSPLTVIQTSASAISIAPDQTDHYLGNIIKECTRMARLISDMLMLASSDAGNWTIKQEDVDVDTLLIETYELFEPVCQRKEIPFSLNMPDRPFPVIVGDKERLTQILAILLDNAISYSPSGKPILLNAYFKNSHLFLQVIDHGPGVPDDKKEQIFDRFYRGDKSRKDKQHFGLGLNIAQELLYLHKGSLSVKDTEGGGSTFVIRI